MRTWTRLKGVHQAEKSGPFHELGAGDPVVLVDVVQGNRPAPALGIGSRVGDLPGHRLLLVGEVLLGALAGIDCGDHPIGSFHLFIGSWNSSRSGGTIDMVASRISFRETPNLSVTSITARRTWYETEGAK